MSNSLDDAAITGLLVLRAADGTGGDKPAAGLVVRLDPGPALFQKLLVRLQSKGWRQVRGDFGHFAKTGPVDCLAHVDCTEPGYLTINIGVEILYTGQPWQDPSAAPLPYGWVELAARRRGAMVYIAMSSQPTTDEASIQAATDRGQVVCGWATLEMNRDWAAAARIRPRPPALGE